MDFKIPKGDLIKKPVQKITTLVFNNNLKSICNRYLLGQYLIN